MVQWSHHHPTLQKKTSRGGFRSQLLGTPSEGKSTSENRGEKKGRRGTERSVIQHVAVTSGWWDMTLDMKRVSADHERGWQPWGQIKREHGPVEMLIEP